MTVLNPFQSCVLEGWPATSGPFGLHCDATARMKALYEGSVVDARLSNLLRDLKGFTTPDEASPVIRSAGDLAMAKIQGYLDRKEVPPHTLSLSAYALREVNAAIWQIPMPPRMSTC